MLVLVIYRTTSNPDNYIEGSPRTNQESDKNDNLKLNEAGNIVKVMKSISRNAPITKIEQDGMIQLLSNKSLQRVSG